MNTVDQSERQGGNQVRPKEDDGALLFPNIEQLSYGSCNTGETNTSKHGTLSH